MDYGSEWTMGVDAHETFAIHDIRAERPVVLLFHASARAYLSYLRTDGVGAVPPAAA
jgi:ribosomal protein L19